MQRRAALYGTVGFCDNLGMARAALKRTLAVFPFVLGGCLLTSTVDDLKGSPHCETKHADCDGVRSNGCESNLDTDSQNCGICGTACPSAPSAAPACIDGKCTIAC